MLLFELIKGGLWQNYVPQTGSDPDWTDLLIQAQQQTVLGITFQAIEKLPDDKRPPKFIFLKWLALAAEIQKQNKEKNEIAAALFQLFEQEDIQAVLLKGQGVARYYPEPTLRQSGDIDIYTGKDFQRSCEILKRHASSSEEKGEKHFAYQWHGIRIENHYHMVLLTKHRYQKIFEKLLDIWFPSEKQNITLPEGQVFVPPLQFDALLILEHLFHHFIHGGVGLRQVIDWLLVMKAAAAEESFDRIQFQQDLESLELLPSAQLFGTIGIHALGFKKEQMPFKIATNDELEKQMLDDILAGGNFGTVSDHRPKGLWRGRWYGFTHSVKRTRKFRCLAPEETKHYAAWRIKHFLLNFIK